MILIHQDTEIDGKKIKPTKSGGFMSLYS